MAHQHNHTNQDIQGTRGLKIALLIVGVLMVVEVVGGILSNSLALIGDAGHMLVDGLALALSLFAISLAHRPATTVRTYGLHRAEIMAALANGVTLVLIAGYIFYEAYQRFFEPREIRSGLMLTVAIIGLLGNIAGIFLLRGASRANLNVRGAFLHILGDTISSVGVIAAAVIVALTGWTYADPIIAVIIGIIVLWGAVRLVRESSDILLEAVPRHIDVQKVIDALKKVEGVVDLHDLHVWSITSGIYALSTHVLIEDVMVSRTHDIIDNINREMTEHFGITHTTLQLECSKCENCAEGFVCQLNRPQSFEVDTHGHGTEQ
ncbi:MAG: cation diffusion facilitator family transporter [Dehalococcoidia bacterium]|nr:cation diffusion facilitator family transporter [Dehalococcoidia bacterium]